MSNRAKEVKKTGRLHYIEPTNFSVQEEGTLSDKINFPYEDYCMAVDLTISQTNRYSCGWWKESGEENSITFSSKNGSLSFFGGTDLGNDEGYYTTNFTDVSMLNPETNTSECLGISSINIAYDSWWYPQVTIKFVDVRGATVMQPAEKGYYENREMGNSSVLYKSLFSFPYPMFTLKVKGFYGKGVTYKLALHNTVFEFDANSGNFNITASFIGFKFGIYTDTPLSFIGSAPFMEGGKEYWNQKINSGEFRFRTKEGAIGSPMVTIPELKLKLAQAVSNQSLLSISVEEEESINALYTKLESLNAIKNTYPINEEWFNYNKKATSKPFCYKIFKHLHEMDEFYSGVTEYMKVVRAYDSQYNEKLGSRLEAFSLKGVAPTTEDYFSREQLIDSHNYSQIVYFEAYYDWGNRTVERYGGHVGQLSRYENELAKTNKFNEAKEKIVDKLKRKESEVYQQGSTEAYQYATRVLNLLEKAGNFFSQDGEVYPFIDDWGDDSIFFNLDFKKWMEEKGDEFFFVVAYPFKYVMDMEEFLKEIQIKQKEIENKIEEVKREYKVKHEQEIERLLGFRPSIKNMYDLMFAHMDTFIHVFYDSTKKIKDQLDTNSRERKKSTYLIEDGYTDTENVRIKRANGVVENNQNSRSLYLPPYAAYYKDDYNGVTKAKKLVWPGDIKDGSLLEEVGFVNRLIDGSKTYFKKVKDIESLIEQMSIANSGTGMDTSFMDVGTPTITVSDFIPTTVFDFIYKDKYGNPYLGINDVINGTKDTIKNNIYVIFLLRAYQYCLFTRYKNAVPGWSSDEKLEEFRKTYKAFGQLEAINLFKAVGDNFTNGFMSFLEEHCFEDTDEGSESFNERVTFMVDSLYKSDSDLNIAVRSNAPNYTTKTLFEKETGKADYFTYKFHIGEPLTKEMQEKCGGIVNLGYKMFPLFVKGVKHLQQLYTRGNEIFEDETMLPVRGRYNEMYSGENSKVSTFVMFDSRDYLSNIYKIIEAELDNSINYTGSANGPLYGNRGSGDFNGFNDKDNIFKEYKNNIESENLISGEYFANVLTTDVEGYNQWFIKPANVDKFLNIGSYSDFSKSEIKFTTFDYTFDEKNPTSIFSNSIYWAQGDNIKAKAFLFLISTPVQSEISKTKNGKVYKISLLKEGAIYWYNDSFGTEEGVKYTDYVRKVECYYNTTEKKHGRTYSQKRVDFEKPTEKNQIPLCHNESIWNDNFDSIEFTTFEYFKISEKLYDWNKKWAKKSEVLITPSRRRILKKFFEDWATDTSENGFKGNEAELTNIEYYSRSFKPKYKDKLLKGTSTYGYKWKGIPEWYYITLAEMEVFHNSGDGKLEIYVDEDAQETETINLGTNFGALFATDSNKDGWYKEEDNEYESRSYDNGLDNVFLLRGNPNSPNAIKLKRLHEFLRDTFFSIYTVFDLYNENVDSLSVGNLITVDNMDVTFNSFDIFYRAVYHCVVGFLNQLRLIYYLPITDYKDNRTAFYENKSLAVKVDPFKNLDVKLSTYMTLKNLYDKWLCYPHNGAKDTWCLKRSNRRAERGEFDNFIYIDTFYNDIGDALLVNATKTSQWLSSIVPTSDISSSEGSLVYTGRTLYEYLTEIAQNVGGNLFAVPQRFALTDENSVKEMFTPMPLYSNWDEEESGYVFMYTYQPSQHLGDSSTSNVDMNGWSSEGDGLDLTDEEITGSVLGENNRSYNIPAFGVTYAKQNQSIFKNIQLTSANMAVTEASISAAMNIAAKSSEGTRELALYGQDLYRVYSNYAYNCSVETMGNMQIMPMMYFQLNNIPFWKGGYQIIKVNHSIVPGNITTTFEGVRINRHAIPMADGAILIQPDDGDELSESSNDNTTNTGGNTEPMDMGEGRISIPDNNFQYLERGKNLEYLICDTEGTNGGPDRYKDHGKIRLLNCTGDTSKKLSFIPQFNEQNITEKKPIIYIHPAHYRYSSDKGDRNVVSSATGEFAWSSRVVDRTCEILRGYTFSDGTSYSQNIQKGRTKTDKTYSGSEAYELVSKYGSKKVISIVPHWNGGAGKYWCGIMNGTSQTTRLDSVKLMSALACEAENVKKNAASYSNMPNDMIKGAVDIRAYIVGEISLDCGTMPNCAAALTENWFADYANWKGRDWLESEEAVNVIAELHAKGIKRYIDSL